MTGADRGGESHTHDAMAAHRLLIVEDDAVLRSQLSRGLGEEGFQIFAVADGATALERADEGADVLIIDIGLPDADGRDLCQALRARGCDAPVLFLTARDALTDRLSGFHAGGDDYLTKPFALAELLVRVGALVRRGGPAPAASPATPDGRLRLDPAGHALVHGDDRVPLTPTEFRILAALAARPGEVVRRGSLVAAAWPQGAVVHDNTLDAYLVRIRRKLRDAGAADAVRTVRGVGYELR
jgi:two-component system, OmpR family, response regulator